MSLTPHFKDFLQLLRWTIRQELPSTNTLKTSLVDLHKMAQFHQLEALLYPSVAQLQWPDDSKDCLSLWQQDHDKSLKRFILYQHERQQLLTKFDQQAIWHAPLKGLTLQPYYPQAYQRQMTDNDILFDPACQKDLKKLMLEQGFYQKSNQSGVVVYMKKPIFNFEMHLKASVYDDFDDYFKDLADRLIPCADGYQRQLSLEDNYIYLLAHELKHFLYGGIGIRYLIDLHYLLAQPLEMDWEHIHQVLDKLAWKTFDDKRQQLVKALFSEDQQAFEQVLEGHEFLERYCYSGTHGTLENLVDAKLTISQQPTHDFLHFYKKVFFPDKTWFETYYPFLWRWKILIPPFLVYRAIRGLFRQQKWQELRLVLRKLFVK